MKELSILLALSVLLNGSGQLLLKRGMEVLVKNGHRNLLGYIGEVATSPLVLMGIVFYGISLLIWLRILTQAEVSFAYPILVSMTFVVVTLGASFILDENVTLLRILGIGVIALGVVIVSWS